MTISKAYALLETEGVLVRNRGKPMTVARQARAQSANALRFSAAIDLPAMASADFHAALTDEF